MAQRDPYSTCRLNYCPLLLSLRAVLSRLQTISHPRKQNRFLPIPLPPTNSNKDGGASTSLHTAWRLSCMRPKRLNNTMRLVTAHPGGAALYFARCVVSSRVLLLTLCSPVPPALVLVRSCFLLALLLPAHPLRVAFLPPTLRGSPPPPPTACPRRHHQPRRANDLQRRAAARSGNSRARRNHPSLALARAAPI